MLFITQSRKQRSDLDRYSKLRLFRDMEVKELWNFVFIISSDKNFTIKTLIYNIIEIKGKKELSNTKIY